jgi:hypothetical protein
MAYQPIPTGRAEIERRLVERATKEPEFRRALCEDPRAAVADELGISIPSSLRISVVEEAPDYLCIVLPVDLSGIAPGAARAATGWL